VVERQLYYSSAAEENVPSDVVGTGFKRCRQGFLVTAKTKQSLQFSISLHAVAGTPSNFLAFGFGKAHPPVSFSFTSAPCQKLMLLCNTSMAYEFENSSIHNHHHANHHQKVAESFS
jgi:hypothetical protein